MGQVGSLPQGDGGAQRETWQQGNVLRGQGIVVQEIKETRFLGRKKMEILVWGSFPCGNRVPLLPGGPCGGAEFSEKYQMAHFGVQERLHPACSYSSQQVELRNVPKGHPEPGPRVRSETGSWALANKDSPISNGTPPILCSNPSINLSSSPTLRKRCHHQAPPQPEQAQL